MFKCNYKTLRLCFNVFHDVKANDLYVFSKLKTGAYRVDVQAGDRVTGANRTFFITPYCFEAKTYEEFLNRYLEIVPGEDFGLSRKNLLPDKELKRFLGY